jgi:hypothetical protein
MTKNPKETGKNAGERRIAHPIGTARTAKARSSGAVSEMLSSILRILQPESTAAGECKILLHLGNRLAFFVDKEKWAGIRFLYSILP